MHHKFPQSSTALSVFAMILTCLFCAVAAMAQEKAAIVEPSAQPQTIGTAGTPAAGKADVLSTDSAPSKTRAEAPALTSTLVTKPNDSAPTTSTPATRLKDNAARGSSDYEKTLNDLQTLYEREVQKLEQQNNKAKELYRDGLVARVEMEKGEKDLVDARAK